MLGFEVFMITIFPNIKPPLATLPLHFYALIFKNMEGVAATKKLSDEKIPAKA